MSDINLYHDKYLKRIYMTNNKGVRPEIFLKFNSIKSLLSDIEKNEKRKNEIIKAVEISKNLLYIKGPDKIYRNKPYDEKLIDADFYDKCTIFISNLPFCINHQNLYDIFKDYKILYISLIKKREKEKDKKYKQAYIILNNKDDVQKIISQYNNVELNNFKIIKTPLHIESKIDVIKREEQKEKEKKDNNIINNSNNKDNFTKNENIIVIEKSKLIEANINGNICLSFTNLKEDIKLLEFIEYLEKLQKPLFVDLDRSKNTAVLRFSSKKESDVFVRNFYNGGAELLKNMFKYEKVSKPRIFNQKENMEYLENVKEKMEEFKSKKLNKKLKKLKLD